MPHWNSSVQSLDPGKKKAIQNNLDALSSAVAQFAFAEKTNNSFHVYAIVWSAVCLRHHCLRSSL